jgi:hypothetical protein
MARRFQRIRNSFTSRTESALQWQSNFSMQDQLALLAASSFED